jgi:hypothetical protein
MNSKELDEESVKTFGVKMSFLTVKEASAFIDILRTEKRMFLPMNCTNPGLLG